MIVLIPCLRTGLKPVQESLVIQNYSYCYLSPFFLSSKNGRYQEHVVMGHQKRLVFEDRDGKEKIWTKRLGQKECQSRVVGKLFNKNNNLTVQRQRSDLSWS